MVAAGGAAAAAFGAGGYFGSVAAQAGPTRQDSIPKPGLVIEQAHVGATARTVTVDRVGGLLCLRTGGGDYCTAADAGKPMLALDGRTGNTSGAVDIIVLDPLKRVRGLRFITAGATRLVSAPAAGVVVAVDASTRPDSVEALDERGNVVASWDTAS